MSTIYTSTPRAMMLGVRDESTREIPLEDIVLPCHLPWAMTFAEQGDGFPHMLMSSGAVRMYGAETFDITGKYATHQTAAINVFMQNANPMMLQRIIPEGAKTALLRLSLEIIPTMIPDYERDPSSGAVLYEFNEFDERVPKVKQMIAGNRVIYHTNVLPWSSQAEGDPLLLELGEATRINKYRAGSVTNKAGEKLGVLDASVSETVPHSTLFPIMDVLVSSEGEFGNRKGIRIILPTTKGANPLDSGTFYESKSYLPRLGLVSVDPKDSSRYVNIATTNGDLFMDVSFKEGVRTERGKVPLFIGDRLVEEYQINSVNQPFIPGPYGKVHVYQDELTAALEVLINGTLAGDPLAGKIKGEKDFNLPENIGDYAHYPLSEDTAHMLNFLGGFDENGIPYHAFETKKSASFDGVAVGNETYIFPYGGKDGLPLTATGEIDELAKYEMFDEAVRHEAENFGLGKVKWLNTAKYPISAVWDTGFSMDTKKALLTPMGLRKDIGVVLATHSVGDYISVAEVDPTTGAMQVVKKFQWMKDNDMDTETGVAGQLREFARNYPESEVYGTPVCRAIIVGQAGRLIGSSYTRRLPLTIEYANKVSRFMGAADGFWNPTRAYDQKGQNIIELMRDINLTWREENVANQQWANGLVYAEDYDMRRMFFPAIRTVYNNETSVLNSSITMWGITTIEREAHNSWRDLVGNAKFSPAKFIQESDRILSERLAKRFDDRFIIEVETYYTESDRLRGYSWSCNIHIYAPNMKTVGQYTVVAHRIEDYQADLAA